MWDEGIQTTYLLIISISLSHSRVDKKRTFETNCLSNQLIYKCVFLNISSLKFYFPKKSLNFIK